MSDGIYLDNDVVLKMCIYMFAEELILATTLNSLPPALLGVAKFTLRARVRRSKSIGNQEAVRSTLEVALAAARLVEPTEEEIELAAELEQRAAGLGQEFDTGESQLVAMLLKRESPLLITGDKRAIRALSHIAPVELNCRLACFEQLIATVILKFGHERLRTHVCAEPATDRAITASFACYSPTSTIQNVVEGLLSYVNDIRKDADRLLITTSDLSAVVSQEHGEGIA